MWSHSNSNSLSFEEGGKKCPSESQRGQQQESVRFWGVRPFFWLGICITSLSPSPRVPTLAMLSAAGSNAQPAQKKKLRSAKSFFNVTTCDTMRFNNIMHKAQHGKWTCLCQFLGFVVERVHYFAHVLNCFKGSFICFVYWRFVKYNQDTFPLVKDS